jgi:DNA-binding XRE family transcriptional regulator
MPPARTKRDRLRIARKIRWFRTRNKLTKTEFGKLIGIGRDTVWAIETARQFPRHSTLARFREVAERFQKGRQLALANKIF